METEELPAQFEQSQDGYYDTQAVEQYQVSR